MSLDFRPAFLLFGLRGVAPTPSIPTTTPRAVFEPLEFVLQRGDVFVLLVGLAVIAPSRSRVGLDLVL